MALAYHEPTSELSPEAREIHRALASLIEELEAVAWYHERVDVTGDAELKAILIHNRNEEIEHAGMALEWLRRLMPEFDEKLRTYLFTTAPITEIEEEEENGEGEGSESTVSAPANNSLGIGSLKKGA